MCVNISYIVLSVSDFSEISHLKTFSLLLLRENTLHSVINWISFFFF